MEIPLYQVDAFTSELFRGNPAAVCLLDSWPDDELLQSIGAENNLSETAFLVPAGADYELRWFTPTVEVALKMALGYWSNIDKPRHRILALEHGYHGDTIGGMSVGARGVFNAAYEPLLFEVGRIPFPGAGHERADQQEQADRSRAGDGRPAGAGHTGAAGAAPSARLTDPGA